MRKKEYIERYGLEAYQRYLEKQNQYGKAHKAERAEYNKQWREKNAEYIKQYYQTNKAEIAEYRKQYYQQNKAEIGERHRQYNKQYRQAPMGRAVRLVQDYKQEDNKRNRGECTLTSKWIVDNIFTSKCVYCGESDWTKLGCDRIDNNLPHTEDNVVCCCGKCNVERHTTEFDVFMERKKAS